jgi:hypothetical protein
LIDRKSILYMKQFADPKASRIELAAIFGVGRQRISQIIGAHGGSKADADLLHQFRHTAPVDLRNHWRVEAHVQALDDYRGGRRAANPLRTPRMTRQVNPVGRWSAYGYQFEIRERDGLYYFRIDAPEEDESNPRNSAKQALDDCFAICRELAWANSSGSQNEWNLAYKEDRWGQPIRRTSLAWATDRWTVLSSNSSGLPTCRNSWRRPRPMRKRSRG